MRLDGKRPWLHAEKHRDTTYGRLRRGSELLVRYVEHLLEKPSVPVEYLMTMQPMFEQRVKARVTPFLCRQNCRNWMAGNEYETRIRKERL
jgi:hypothetical protein